MATAKKHTKKKESENSADEKEKHCICNSRDYTTLMICCDYCSVWYHVQCVKVTEKEAKIIKKFACRFCIDKDANCVTVYKKWAKGVVMDKKKGGKSGGKSKETGVSGKTADQKEGKNAVEKQRKERERSGGETSRTNTTTNGKSSKKMPKMAEDNNEGESCGTKTTTTTNNFGGTTVRPPSPLTDQQKRQLELQEANTELRCKKCIGCFREKNCGKCFTCVRNDGQCCMDRICVQVEELLKQQQQQQQQNRMAKNEVKKEDDDGHDECAKMGEIGGGQPKSKGSKKGRKPKADKQQKHHSKTDQQRKHYHHHYYGTMTAADEQAAINAQLRKAYEASVKRRVQQNSRSDGGSSSKTEENEDLQCHGPGCTSSARIGSKYCSDFCGIALAKQRLSLILPQRFNAFFGDAPHSQTENNAQIERIREQMGEMNTKLYELEQWRNNVHQFIMVLKSNTITTTEQQQQTATIATATTDEDEEVVEKKAKSEDENLLIGCPVCNGEFQMRELCKHVHTCFVRSERQTTYGTDYQIQNNQFNLYCEAFNKIDGTFCKRLRYACAEHYRDEYELELCGCPLGWYKGGSLEFREMFASSRQPTDGAASSSSSLPSFGDGGFCREKQKNCRDHKNWAQTAFSLIDNERLNLLNRCDELGEQQRQLQLKLLQRGDILSLICNSTERSTSPLID